MDVLRTSISVKSRFFLSTLQSKIFTNGSATVPKAVRETLGVDAGDCVHYDVSEDGLQIVKAQSFPETACMFARNGQY